ncbi:hypothetical protein NQ129_08035 [Priestia aryabhattai]|uniref:hypothetical protein n=1 Tax=Priestia aryabhattai TaxID=412384 RepID=UPI00211CFFFA|nr:hypothetical protein [Priestia aryabhattai]MCQ9281723.1 hypothetical protein [Priestia aryabhattai]
MKTKSVTALISIKNQTKGLFTGGKGYAKFIGTDTQLNIIMTEFRQIKHLFLNPTDKSVCHFLVEHKEYLQSERFDTLAQIVLILLGYESQAAYDNGDKELEATLLKDVVIWKYMNQYARKVAGGKWLEL